MSNDDEQITAEFDKCPAYGSIKRFAESVAEEQREKGLVGEGLKYGIYQVGGPILDPSKVSQMLVGTMIPAITALLDVCLDCGAVYAVRLERSEVSLRMVVAQPVPGQSPPGFRPSQLMG